jgi:hypothetical protein
MNDVVTQNAGAGKVIWMSLMSLKIKSATMIALSAIFAEIGADERRWIFITRVSRGLSPSVPRLK